MEVVDGVVTPEDNSLPLLNNNHKIMNKTDKLIKKLLVSMEEDSKHLVQCESDISYFLEALGIDNVHNAKEAIASRDRKIHKLETTIQELCEHYGVSHIGNLKQKFDALCKEQVVCNRLQFLTSVPYVGYVSAEKAESSLNRLDKKCRSLLDLERPELRDDLYKHLTEQYRENCYEDFLELLIELHALQVHGKVEAPHLQQKEEQQQEDSNFMIYQWFESSIAEQIIGSLASNELGCVAMESELSVSTTRHIDAQSRLCLDPSDIPGAMLYLSPALTEVYGGMIAVANDADLQLVLNNLIDQPEVVVEALKSGGVQSLKDYVSKAIIALD